MKSKNIKKIIAVIALSLSTFFCTATMVSARIRHIHHSSSHSGTHSSFSDDPVGATIALTILGIGGLAFVAIFIYSKVIARKEKKYGNYMINPNLLPKDHTSEIINTIYQVDTSFQEPSFMNMAENDLRTILDTISSRELADIDNVAVDSASQKLKQKIYDLRNDGLQIKMENFQMKNRYLTLYQRDRNFEYLTAYFAFTYKEIVRKQENNYKPKNNGKNQQFIMMTYTRDRTAYQSRIPNQQMQCRNCRNIISADNYICPSCGETVMTDFNWILTDWTDLETETPTKP